jgi:hypothetical protein
MRHLQHKNSDISSDPSGSTVLELPKRQRESPRRCPALRVLQDASGGKWEKGEPDKTKDLHCPYKEVVNKLRRLDLCGCAIRPYSFFTRVRSAA